MRSLLDRFRPECHRVREVLQSYLDGELGADDADMVAAHLEHCERCGIEADLYERVKASLRSLHQPADPDAVDRLRRYASDLLDGSGADPDGPAPAPPG